MADMIDVILASGLSSRGQIKTYAQMAANAVANANTAVETVNSVADDAATAKDNAQEALATMNTILDDISSATITEIDKLILSMQYVNGVNAAVVKLDTTYPDNTVRSINELVKFYKELGLNEDGGMTQKAIKEALDALELRLITIINQSGGSSGGGGSTNLGSENAGKIVIVGPDGNIIPGTILEDNLVNLLIKNSDYEIEGAVGLEIDYVNKVNKRTQEARILGGGDDFDSYPMYGGRMRCNVLDNGTISAFYGDPNYTEDGSNGQVMVYQPKFYYMRTPVETEDISTGRVIRKEILILTGEPESGFKLHPAFITPNGDELDYILLSAYEGCAQVNDEYDLEDLRMTDLSTAKLSSIANAKPISGVKKPFTIAAAEQMAQNRGTQWHILNLAALNINQMLLAIEYGTLNGQRAIEKGITEVTNNSSYNCSAYTGSTSELGNATGHATSTITSINGQRTTRTSNGQRAISYRGYENPWGNIWSMIGGLTISGNGNQNGGAVYICRDFNYTPGSTSANNYDNLNVILPNNNDWISGMAYCSRDYDWVYIPIEASGANSSVPVGDTIWTTAALNGFDMALCGGMWYFGDEVGLYCYSFDREYNFAARSFSARLMLIPNKDSIYNSNISKWQAHFSA